ncbi:hypothetical protein AVEN_234993-1 [Araneus ventricosus]|uniref:Uncharacterized protein n=1 Tax=Araneus ventricosus TaxID=182803 RepID=A0A4Y2FRL5_ARAVE|nr:hypothetical protein AVEN_234993-1 [Araneus ventricosus]
MASAVLDFEGFQLSPGRFIVKEPAVCAVNDDTFCGRWMFKSPHSFESLDRKKQNTYSWITKFLHHIEWEDGELPYDTFHCVSTVIFETFPYIYVKGLEEKKFLEFLTYRDILNLDYFECPEVKDLPSFDVLCPYMHGNSFYHCAVYIAKEFAKHLETI